MAIGRRGRDSRWARAAWAALLAVVGAAWAETVEPPVVSSAPAEETVGFAAGAIVPINGDISDVTTESIKRRVEAARRNGAQIVVFEINTPGGMVSSALDICDYIKNLAELKTVAWINTQAYSAGSMIALACNEIVMSPRSTIGDCGVVLGGPTGVEEVPEGLRAKAESPVLEQFRDSAARNGYNTLLCESLVIKEKVVYWVENETTRERCFVSEEDKKKLLGEGGSPTSAPAGEAAGEPPAGQWRLVTSYVDPVTSKAVPLDQPVVRGTELLTMSQSTATVFGFCKAILGDPEELHRYYRVGAAWQELDFTWSELLTRYLTSMPVRAFLLIVIFLGAYVEFHTPGTALAGIVALIALTVFVGAPYLTGLANVWEIVLILAGFVLLALEILVIPGFGVAGVAGILCILVGLLATFVPNEPGQPFPIYWPRMEWGLRSLKIGVITLASSLTASVVGMVMLSRYLPKVSWMRGMIPENPTRAAVEIDDPYHGYARPGDVGRVSSPLRPAGKAWFGQVLVDVVTQGEFLEPPAEVEVIEREGNRVVVRRLDQGPAA